jgi:alkaline phosphatase
MGKGYTVATTTDEYKSLTGKEEKVFIISDDKDYSDDTGAMHYEIDRPKTQASLADYVKTGIDYLMNDKGFFMMVEGGKIDWACHANDAAATIHDVIAFDKAVQVAVDFYDKHKNETLIIVTGDHETGGLSIGFAGTAYDTHLEILANQKMSFIEFDKQIANYRKNNTKFDDVMKDIKANFGLMAANDPDASKKPLLVLTDYELATIKTSYEKSMLPSAVRTINQAENILYGTYEPLSITLTHILNQKAGIGWTSYAHTGVPVPVFAMGVGEDLFNSFYDNTQIFFNLKALTKVK